MRSFFIKLRMTTCTVVLVCLIPTTGWGQSKAEILARLDDAAKSFVGATATIRVITHTGIVNEDDIQIGTVAVKRYSQNEMQFLINFTGENAKAIALRGQTLEIFYPKLNIIREYDVGKYRDGKYGDLVQKLILLGFGMRGRELATDYDISNLGREQIQAQDTVHLQLTPKAADILNQLSRVELWISLKNNCPLQQRFDLPGGDYRLVTYSDVKVTPPTSSALDLPKGAKRERMN